MADFLYILAEWAGIEVATASWRSRLLSFLIRFLLGVLMVLGGVAALVQHNGISGVLIGIFVLVFGIGLLARIMIDRQKTQRDGSGAT